MRRMLVGALRRAGAEANNAQRAFAAPYSSHDVAVTFYEARGYQRGLAKAVEILDHELGGATVSFKGGIWVKYPSWPWRLHRSAN